VGAIDILKGFLPAIVFSAWGPAAAGIAGLFAVLGHIFSPFLGGRGGKGVATTLGAVLGVQPLWAIPMLAAFGVTVAITRKIGLGAVAGAVTLIAIGVFWAGVPEERAFAIALGVVVIIRHESNLRAALGGGSRQQE
jgi:glycerol-3-phosphate acyltransferase PlsY